MQLWNKTRATVEKVVLGHTNLILCCSGQKTSKRVRMLVGSIWIGRTSSFLQYFCMMPKDLSTGTPQKHHQQQAYLLRECFGDSLMANNPSSHVRLFYLAFFCSASIQPVLTRTVGSKKYKDHSRTQPLNGIYLPRFLYSLRLHPLVSHVSLRSDYVKSKVPKAVNHSIHRLLRV